MPMGADPAALWKAAAILVATVAALANLRRAGATANPTVFRLLTVGMLAVAVVAVLVI